MYGAVLYHMCHKLYFLSLCPYGALMLHCDVPAGSTVMCLKSHNDFQRNCAVAHTACAHAAPWPGTVCISWLHMYAG